ncbi:UNVERIFIED_CONTAM: DnaJ protein P58IPK, partial [Sesamum calycinum]
QGLDVIAEGLDTLKNMAQDMNEEVDRQVPLMDEIDTKVDKATADLKNTNVRLKDTVISTTLSPIFAVFMELLVFLQLRSSRNFCIDIILLCVILGIAAYLYKASEDKEIKLRHPKRLQVDSKWTDSVPLCRGSKWIHSGIILCHWSFVAAGVFAWFLQLVDCVTVKVETICTVTNVGFQMEMGMGMKVFGFDLVACRGFIYTVFILNFVFCCQLILLQPLVAAIDGKPGDPATLFERVSQSIKVKKYSEALAELNAAIEADPALSEAYSHRASVLRQLCRYEESEESYKKFLEVKPGNSAAEKELSQLHQARNALDSANNLFNSGDFDKALEYIEKVVLVFSPACSKAKLLKVRLLIATKDYSSAISESGYILKEDEDNLEALLYGKGLRLDPEHGELKKAYFGLKNLLKKTKSAEDNASKGKLRLAVEDYKAALALDPAHSAHNVHLHLGLCKVSVKLGRGKDAVASCTEALEIDGDLVEALAQRGEAKLLVEDWEGAVADLKSAAEKSPQDMNIREALMKAERSLKLSQRKDWYKILGVSKTASMSEIKKAYKKLALQWHPDKNVDNREEAEAKFREIAAAYEILGDEDKRTRYDRGEDLDDMGTGMGGGGFNPFGGGGQQYTFHFEGGFPGGGFPAASNNTMSSASASGSNAQPPGLKTYFKTPEGKYKLQYEKTHPPGLLHYAHGKTATQVQINVVGNPNFDGKGTYLVFNVGDAIFISDLNSQDKDPIKAIHFSNSNPVCHTYDPDAKDGPYLLIGLHSGDVYAFTLLILRD